MSKKVFFPEKVNVSDYEKIITENMKLFKLLCYSLF